MISNLLRAQAQGKDPHECLSVLMCCLRHGGSPHTSYDSAILAQSWSREGRVQPQQKLMNLRPKRMTVVAGVLVLIALLLKKSRQSSRTQIMEIAAAALGGLLSSSCCTIQVCLRRIVLVDGTFSFTTECFWQVHDSLIPLLSFPLTACFEFRLSELCWVRCLG